MRIESLNNFVFVAIRELYYIQVINDVEKMFVHSVSEERYSAKHVESKLQDEIYCTRMINEVKKIFIHSVSENMSTCSAMHVRSMLLRIMTLAVQEMHLDEYIFQEIEFLNSNQQFRKVQTLKRQLIKIAT